MRALRLFVFFFLLTGLTAYAQEDTAVYAIQNINTAFLNQNTEFRLQFNVIIRGSNPLQAETTVAVLDTLTDAEIITQQVPPLGADNLETVTLSIPVTALQPGTQSLRILLTDTAGATLAESRIRVTVPGSTTPGTPAPDTGAPQPDTTSPSFNIYNIRVDLTNPLHLLALVGFAIAALMLLLMLFLLYLLLRRKPQFPPWQPVYSSSTPQWNPNSQAARRQGWQVHAQNDQPPPPPQQEGATHMRKLLTSLDGKNLQNWRITALRLSQFDQYGRVTRSQVIVPGGLARRLNRAAHKSAGQSVEQGIRRMRPIAAALVKQLRRHITPRSAMLPIALDIRLQGTHGEVRIIFELFMMQGGQWQMIDQWEPEMNIAGKTIQENYTYTLHGMRPAENFKSFIQRLQGDLTRLLVEMANKQPVPGQEVKEDTAQQKAIRAE